MSILLRGDLVHCPRRGALAILHDHLLAVDADGFITHLAPAAAAASHALAAAAPSPPTAVPRGSFLLPSFTDLHLHAPQLLYHGTRLRLPLMRWLEHCAYGAEERLDADPALARRVYVRLAQRLIENGTGAVLLFGTIRTETNLILAATMQAAGVRAFVGKLSMDMSPRPTYAEPSAPAALAAAESFAARTAALTAALPPHRRLVAPALAPRFVPACSDALLAGLGALAAAQRLRVTSHIAEARDEVAWVRRTRGAEDVDVLDRAGLLTPRAVHAHGVHLTRADHARLAARGTALAHCALSNAYFAGGALPLKEVLEAGVAGGYAPDVQSAMRAAVMVARMRAGEEDEEEKTEEEGEEDRKDDEAGAPVDWRTALFLATRGGAEALGLDGIGTFAVGAPFDAQQITLFDASGRGVGALDFFDAPGPLAEDDVEKWWCLGDTRNRAGMWVQGRALRADVDVEAEVTAAVGAV